MKQKVNNNGIIIEFDSQAEHDAWVAAHSPNDEQLLAKIEANLRAEAVGKDLIRDLYRTLKDQNLTDAEEGDLLNRIYPILGTLGDGFIRGARVICNATPTGGQLTAGRKTFLLNVIDQAITQL